MTTWTKRITASVSWTLNRVKSFLLQEDSSHLLMENGFKLVIAGSTEPEYTKRTKPSTSWTNRIKP